jgi:hypothetical protein
MSATRHLPSLATLLAVTLAGSAQTTPPKPELLLSHPSSQMPSYEVATIKPVDPNAASSQVRLEVLVIDSIERPTSN